MEMDNIGATSVTGHPPSSTVKGKDRSVMNSTVNGTGHATGSTTPVSGAKARNDGSDLDLTKVKKEEDWYESDNASHVQQHNDGSGKQQTTEAQQNLKREHNDTVRESALLDTSQDDGNVVPKEEKLEMHEDQAQDENAPERIQAYAKLEFPFFNFYIQKLSVTIGRRPPESRSGSIPPHLGEPTNDEAPSNDNKAVPEDSVEESSTKIATTTDISKPEGGIPDAKIDNPFIDPGKPVAPANDVSDSKDNISDSQAETSKGNAARFSGNKVQVDVDLGPIKAVSRDHARLFFDSTINPRTGVSKGWSIEVRGRNGLVLDGKWRAKGEIVRLMNMAKIQIAERIFHFVLPTGVPYPSAPPSPVQDGYYEAQPANGHGFHGSHYATSDRSYSQPLVYGSDSDELRSDDDDAGDNGEFEEEYDEYGRPVPYGQGSNGMSHIVGPDGQIIRRKRGRPPKPKTAEQIAAIELEKARKLDPTIPRRPRGRPPKNREASEDSDQQGETLAIAGVVPSISPSKRGPAGQVPPTSATIASTLKGASEPAKLTKKQLAEAKRLEKQKLKEEKAKQRDLEKQEREAAKLAKQQEKIEKENQKRQQMEQQQLQKQAAAAAAAAKKAAGEVPPAKMPNTTMLPVNQNIAPAPSGGVPLAPRVLKPPETPTKTSLTQPANKPMGPGTNQPLLPHVQSDHTSTPKSAVPISKTAPAKKPSIPVNSSVTPFTPTNQFQGKPDKPPYSYAALIAQAIYSMPNKQATLQHFLSWIPRHYPYFQDNLPVLQAGIRRDLAVNRAFVNIPLQSGVALWALDPEQAKLFDGNTFLPPPSAPPPPKPKPAVSVPSFSPSMSPAPQVAAPVAAPATASPAPQTAPATSPSKANIPILISSLPASYTKPVPPANSGATDPASMLDPAGFPPIAIHENKMYLSPSIFATLTAQQLSNLQTIETKQALNILQAFVVNYFKTELKKKKKAEKAAAAAAAASASGTPVGSPAPEQNLKRPAPDSQPSSSKAPKLS